jgi:HTH-type transcriptional regulator / antitoxin HigA
MITAKKKIKYNPDYAIPPGETLEETIESLNMSQAELSRRTELTIQTINRIFKGSQPITYETANRLELATGVPARMWNNLEANYREQLLKIAEEKRLAADISWLIEIPTNELIQRGILPDITNKTQLVREALKFYGVNSVNAWRKTWTTPAVAARRSFCFETQIGPASAWIRQGELQAVEIECETYSKEKFKQALVQVRKLSTLSPKEFVPEMKRLCAESGVAVTFVKEMPKVPWNGATKWLSPNKAMIILCLRGKGEDRFWFSFFHEVWHVLNPIKKNLLINNGSSTDPEEKKADQFAAEILIPSKYNAEIVGNPCIATFRRIASELQIAVGIVVGRYQFLTGEWGRFRGEIRRLGWKG